MTGEPGLSKHELTGVARGQRQMLLLMASYSPLAAYVAYVFLTPSTRIELTIAIWVQIGLAIVQLVAVTRLALILHRSLAILFLLLALVPFVNLFSLLYLNQRATRILKAHGIVVGFLGARTSELRKVKFRHDECAKCGKSASFAVLECPRCHLRFCERCAGRTTTGGETGEAFTTTCRRCKSTLNDLRVSVADNGAPQEREGS